MRSLIVVLALVTLVISPAHAELYKWVDQDGNVMYTQTPPPAGAQVEKIAPPPPPPTPVAKPQPVATTQTENKNKEPKEDDAAKRSFEDQSAAIAKQNCETARKNLDVYKTAKHVRTASNEVVHLDDKNRAAKVKEVEKDIKTYCK